MAYIIKDKGSNLLGELTVFVHCRYAYTTFCC